MFPQNRERREWEKGNYLDKARERGWSDIEHSQQCICLVLPMDGVTRILTASLCRAKRY